MMHVLGPLLWISRQTCCPDQLISAVDWYTGGVNLSMPMSVWLGAMECVNQYRQLTATVECFEPEPEPAAACVGEWGAWGACSTSCGTDISA
jgi:hypothetical protein